MYLPDGLVTLGLDGRRQVLMARRNKSLVAGLICGLCCVACVGVYVAQVDAQASAVRAEALSRYGGDQLEVCVARRDVSAGEVLDDASVETKMWVAALLPEGALTSKVEAVGKQVGSSILAGEVISSKRFEAADSMIEVPDGLSAVSVPAREVQAVGGALVPGMRADVYAVGSTSTSKLVAGALVIATSASEAGLSSGSTAWVTLAVPPSAVEELVSAAQNLELYFVLPTAAPDGGSAGKGGGKGA